MTTTKLLSRYRNGNCTVTLYADGTKVREWEGEPAPERPESIDLKVTESCLVGCAYCHESATPGGNHARLETVEEILADAQPGMEVAIGGGDPMAWPSLPAALVWMGDRGLVANVTINGAATHEDVHAIRALQDIGLIHGVGVSWVRGMEHPQFENAAIHAIVGVHDPEEVVEWFHDEWAGEAVLLLGFKRWGRGVDYYSAAAESNIARWRESLHCLALVVRALSFDNLALEQLHVRSFVSSATWDRCYMGDDGRFTMYVDAVTDSFAANSTRQRIPRDGRTLSEMFGSLRVAD